MHAIKGILLLALILPLTQVLLPACDDAPAGNNTNNVNNANNVNNTNNANNVNNTNNGTPVVERFGDRIWGQVLGLSMVDGRLWVGSRTVPDPDDPASLRTALIALEPASGRIHNYEPSLPRRDYDFGDGPVSGPVQTAQVFSRAGYEMIVSDSGLVDFGEMMPPLRVIEHGGRVLVPTGVAWIGDTDPPTVWLTHGAGIARLEHEFYTVVGTWDATALGGEWAHSPAGTPDGHLFAVVSGAGGTRLVHLDGEGVRGLSPADVGAPAGSFTRVVTDPDTGLAYAAVASWDGPSPALIAWDGEGEPQILATEADLGDSDSPAHDVFGPGELALDAGAGVLAVGGRLRSSMTGLSGGGLLWYRIPDGAIVRADAGNSPFFAIHAGPLAHDPDTHTTYAVIYEPCSDVQLRNRGVFSFSFDAAGRLVVGRPLVSGVRALHDDGAGGVLAGLRDDNPGYGCEGYAISTGLYALHENGWARLLDPVAADPENNPISALPSVVDLDVAPDGTLALATWRDGLMVGDDAVMDDWNQALDWGVSNTATTVLWEDDGAALWLAGISTHQAGDPENLADAGPMGAVRLVYDGVGRFTGHRHFVSALRPDLADADTVQGLPSGEVLEVRPLGDGRFLLVCGAERLLPAGPDRRPRDLFLPGGEARPGGLAVADAADDSITVVAAGADLPDPRSALAIGDDHYLVLDATLGLVEVTAGVVTPWSPPEGGAELPGEPVGLAAGDGWWAWLTGTGARLYWPEPVVVDQTGWAWTAISHGGSVLLGTDRGLIRLTPAGRAPAPLPPPPATFPIPF